MILWALQTVPICWDHRTNSWLLRCPVVGWSWIDTHMSGSWQTGCEQGKKLGYLSHYSSGQSWLLSAPTSSKKKDQAPVGKHFTGSALYPYYYCLLSQRKSCVAKPSLPHGKRTEKKLLPFLKFRGHWWFPLSFRTWLWSHLYSVATQSIRPMDLSIQPMDLSAQPMDQSTWPMDQSTLQMDQSTLWMDLSIPPAHTIPPTSQSSPMSSPTSPIMLSLNTYTKMELTLPRNSWWNARFNDTEAPMQVALLPHETPETSTMS